MKLSNIQLTALAEQMALEINNTIKAENNIIISKFKKSEKYKKLLKEFDAIKLAAKSLSKNKCINSYWLNNVKNSTLEARCSTKKLVLTHEIKSFLILSSINCEDLQSLRNTVAKKFK
jgi:hypothetical protein